MNASLEQDRLTSREQARFNMVEQQIRTWEVLDPKVLDLLHHVHREDYVPAEHQGLAFADLEIPLGFNAVMLSPKLEARMLQALELQPQDEVLEVGTGSGHMTALLASLTRHVTSVEICPELSARAGQTLTAHGVENVTLEIGDAARSWGDRQFDVIVLTGSTPIMPETYKQQLNIGGRLLVIVGEAPVMQAILVKRVSESAYSKEILFETCIPPLENTLQPERFVF